MDEFYYDPNQPTIAPVQTNTPPPFSMVSGNDPNMGSARFYNIDQNGQPQEYLPPTGQPTQPYQPQIPQVQGGAQYATQGTIQPYQQQQQGYGSPYPVQVYQPTPMENPAWMNDPAYQKLNQQMTINSMQNFNNQLSTKGSKWDGVKVFAQKIAPIVGAAIGGGAVGGSMAQMSRQAILQNRAMKQQAQQNAISALNATQHWNQAFSMKPLQAQITAQNKAAQFNAQQQNMAAGKGYTADQSMQRLGIAEAGKNTRATNAEAARMARFNTGEDRRERAMAFNQKYKIDTMNNKRELDDRIQTRLEGAEKRIGEFQRLSLLARMRGQDISQDQHAQNLAYKIQEDMLDHELDINKANIKAEMDFHKLQSEGKLPEGTKLEDFMLDYQAANSINPRELGMNSQQFDSLLNEIQNFGKGRPQQQRQGYGDAFTTQGTMQQVAQPQGMQAVPGQLGQPMPQQPQMQQAPQAMPQQQQQSPYAQYSPMFGAPQTQQGKGISMKQPQMPKLSKIGMQAFQRVTQKYKPEEAKMMLVRRLMQPPYNLTYEQANMKASGQ